MADTLLRQIALVADSKRISASDLSRVSAALQKQATRDLVQFWAVKATVDAFPTLEDVPIGYWPIIMMDDINEPGAAGFHTEDSNGQPFALVTASDDLDVWSLTASHEMLEMLVDPSGNRLMAGDSPKTDQGRVQFLVEVCDPPEDARFAYTVNGILVSDFYSPHYFDPVAAQGVRYSFTGAVQRPRDVLRGGYLSWVEPVSNNWWQETWFSGAQSSFRNLGPLSAQNGSFRSQLDRITSQDTQQALAGGMAAAIAKGVPAETGHDVTLARTASLRQQISFLTGRSDDRSTGTQVDRTDRLAAVASAGRAMNNRDTQKRRPGREDRRRSAPSVWGAEAAE